MMAPSKRHIGLLIVALMMSAIITGYHVFNNSGGVFQTEQGFSWNFIWQTFFSWFMPLAISLAIGAALGYLLFTWIKKGRS